MRGYRRSGWRGLGISAPTVVIEKEKPKAIDVTRLSSQDLNSLQKAVQAFHRRIEKRAHEQRRAIEANRQIAEQNKLLRAEYERLLKLREDWERANVTRLKWDRSDLEKEILKNEISLLGAIFGTESVEFLGKRVTPVMRPLVDRWKKLGETIQAIYKNAPPSPSLHLVPLEKVPGPYRSTNRRLSISGVETLVDLSALDLALIDQELMQRKSKDQQERLRTLEAKTEQKARERDLRAKAAQNAKERRRDAKRAPAGFAKQLSILPVCPYCQGELVFEDSHLDHIYPVSKGGLSTKANMVFCCATCNANKRDMTLRRFIVYAGLDQEAVYASLDVLGKDH